MQLLIYNNISTNNISVCNWRKQSRIGFRKSHIERSIRNVT